MRAPARRLPLSGGTAHTGGCTFAGYTVRETAGAAAVVTIHDGTSATGALLATIGLAADASDQHDCAVYAATGVFIEVVSGTVEGSVFVA